MDNPKNDKYYLDKIRQNLQFIVKHMRDVDIHELSENEVLLDSMLFRMIQVSENAKNYRMNIKKKLRLFLGGLCTGLEIE